MTGNTYFTNMIHEKGFTAESFVRTFNNVYPSNKISLSTVQSWMSGRRTFAKSAAETVLRVAHVLDDPDASERDIERYDYIAYRLIFGYGS